MSSRFSWVFQPQPSDRCLRPKVSDFRCLAIPRLAKWVFLTNSLPLSHQYLATSKADRTGSAILNPKPNLTLDAMKSLEDKLKNWKNPVEMLRNAQVGPYLFPIDPEFSNWRDEQEAWQNTAALFDLSHHMTDIAFEGPDLMRLLSDLAVNSFATFAPGKAKQMVCCNPEGYVIGDAILFGLGENKVNISGRPSVPHWVAYNAETGDYDVTVTSDERSVQNEGRRQTFRFQIQGPNAMAILEKAVDTCSTHAFPRRPETSGKRRERSRTSPNGIILPVNPLGVDLASWLLSLPAPTEAREGRYDFAQGARFQTS